MDDDDLSPRFRRWAEAQVPVTPLLPVPDVASVSRRPPRRRSVWVVVAAAAAVLGAVAVPTAWSRRDLEPVVVAPGGMAPAPMPAPTPGTAAGTGTIPRRPATVLATIKRDVPGGAPVSLTVTDEVASPGGPSPMSPPSACADDRQYQLGFGLPGETDKPMSGMSSPSRPPQALLGIDQSEWSLGTGPTSAVRTVVVRAGEGPVGSVELVVDGVTHDRSPVTDGWAVLGYVLPGSGFVGMPTPFSGTVVAVGADGSRTPIAFPQQRTC
jgi:hypothetical protein